MKLYEQRDFDTVIAIGSANPEQFRYQATLSQGCYTRDLRKIVKRLHTNNASATSFFNTYKSELRPQLERLMSTKNRTSLVRHLCTSLQLNEENANAYGHRLITESQQKLIVTWTGAMSHKRARCVATLLQKPLPEIDALIKAYSDYLLYSDAAQQLGYTVADPHRAPIKRFIAQRRIHAERKQIEAATAERLKNINEKLKTAGADQGDIARRLATYNLELIEIIAHRNTHQKTHQKHHDNPLKELSQLENHTQALVEKYVAIYAKRQPDISLTELAKAKHEIAQLILDIFTLEQSAKNHLVVTITEYRRLYDEQQTLITLREARHAYAGKS